MSISKRAKSSVYVGVPIWSLTTRTVSCVLPTFSIVLMKFFPFKPNTHAMRTMKYFSSVRLTANSPSSFV